MAFLTMVLMVQAGCATSKVQRAAINSDYDVVVAQQLWHLQYQGKNYRLPAMLSLNAEALQVVVMNDFGQRLVTIEDSKGTLKIDAHQSHPVRSLWPRLIEAVYWVYWPVEDLQDVAPVGWKFMDLDEGRQVRSSGKQVASIHYNDVDPWQSVTEYRRADGSFSLRVESKLLEADPRPGAEF